MEKPTEDLDDLERLSLRHRVGRWLFVVILALPSFWLLAVTPPLWRDTDGWAQLTGKPGVLTLLHWPPAYCFGARVPLWIGTQLGAALGQGEPAVEDFFYEPNITDGGVYGVILTQHLLLVLTLVFVIATLTSSGWMRAALALIAAGQLPLYVYAQTIGSETLSTILTLVYLATAYLFVVRRDGRSWPGWVLTAGVLLLLIGTRHVNAVFCSVLPLYYLTRVALSLSPLRGRLGGTVGHAARGFAGSMVIGVGALIALQGISQYVCAANNTKYRSTVGNTFQWRLLDFASLNEATRDQVWRAVTPYLEDAPELRKVIAESERADDTTIGTAALSARVREAVDTAHSQESNSEVKYRSDLQMNELTKEFILHAGMPFWKMVGKDWLRGFTFTSRQLAWEPFVTTSYFTWPENLPRKETTEIRKLGTYQWFESLGPEPVYAQNSYLWLARGGYSMGVLMFAGLLCGGLLLFQRDREAQTAGLYMAACLLSAILLLWITKMLTHDMPRFVLPLYATGVYVFLLGLATLARLLPERRGRDSQRSSA